MLSRTGGRAWTLTWISDIRMVLWFEIIDELRKLTDSISKELEFWVLLLKHKQESFVTFYVTFSNVWEICAIFFEWRKSTLEISISNATALLVVLDIYNPACINEISNSLKFQSKRWLNVCGFKVKNHDSQQKKDSFCVRKTARKICVRLKSGTLFVIHDRWVVIYSPHSLQPEINFLKSGHF